jgi:hypothetical protein
MARKNAPSKSPVPPRRPAGVAGGRASAPPSRAEGRAGILQRLRAEAGDEPKRMKSGGMCRGMGKAGRGGRYGKSG